jgi:hypothetical protein
MKIVYLLLLHLLWPYGQSQQTLTEADVNLTGLKISKEVIDKYVLNHKNAIIAFAKVSGKKNLVRVKNDNWPDETEYTYNIVKDNSGRIMMIAELPYSESGDWYIEYKHYFDENGKTFAFSESESIFNDEVKGGVVRKMLSKYYDANFRTLSQINSLLDKDGKPLAKNKNSFDFREYKYSIYKNLAECLAGYHIRP